MTGAALRRRRPISRRALSLARGSPSGAGIHLSPSPRPPHRPLRTFSRANGSTTPCKSGCQNSFGSSTTRGSERNCAEIAPHGFRLGRVRRAEIDQQHAHRRDGGLIQASLLKCFGESALESLTLVPDQMKRMLRARKASRAHIRRIGGEGGAQRVAQRAITAVVLEVAAGDAGQIVDHEHLAVGLSARADADRRRGDLAG